MIFINLFDFHCDTAYRMFTENKDLNNSDLCVNNKNIEIFNKFMSCFAIWIPNKFRGKNAFNFFIKVIENVKPMIDKFNLIKNKKIMFTVEGGASLAGDIENIKILKQYEVKILTLTWNGSCEIGDGCMVKKSSGITRFGIDVIKNLEKNDILIDVSHASDELFRDVISIVKKPIIASHSNARKICNHKRNLTDEQFNAIKKSGGIVGINFCDEFLKESGNAKTEDIFMHIEHFLSLSGEKNICIGTDFDGAKTLKDINDISEIYKLYEFMLKKNYKENLIKKIFYENAFHVINF